MSNTIQFKMNNITDTTQIEQWAELHGMSYDDREMLVGKCLASEEIHKRYQAKALAEARDLLSYFKSIGMDQQGQHLMLAKCRQHPESYRSYLHSARDASQVQGKSPKPTGRVNPPKPAATKPKPSYSKEKAERYRAMGYIVDAD